LRRPTIRDRAGSVSCRNSLASRLINTSDVSRSDPQTSRPRRPLPAVLASPGGLNPPSNSALSLTRKFDSRASRGNRALQWCFFLLQAPSIASALPPANVAPGRPSRIKILVVPRSGLVEPVGNDSDHDCGSRSGPGRRFHDVPWPSARPALSPAANPRAQPFQTRPTESWAMPSSRMNQPAVGPPWFPFFRPWRAPEEVITSSNPCSAPRLLGV